jgi:hypothetical protein
MVQGDDHVAGDGRQSVDAAGQGQRQEAGGGDGVPQAHGRVVAAGGEQGAPCRDR